MKQMTIVIGILEWPAWLALDVHRRRRAGHWSLSRAPCSFPKARAGGSPKGGTSGPGKTLSRIGGASYAENALAEIEATSGPVARGRLRGSGIAGGLGLQQWSGINVIFNYAEELVAIGFVDRLGRRALIAGCAGIGGAPRVRSGSIPASVLAA